MTNKYVPPEGKLVHLTRLEAEELARLPLEGKVCPAGIDKTVDMTHGPAGAGKTTLAQKIFSGLPEDKKQCTVYIGADEKGAMDAIPAYREGIKGADKETRHQLWRMFQNDADYVRSRTLDLAIDGGYALVLDTTGSGTKGINTAGILGAAGYALHVSSCWAPLPVCVERVENRERQAHPAYLLTKRIGAYQSFEALRTMADVLDIFYSSQAERESGLVLSVKRIALQDSSLESVSPHPNLLKMMAAAMSCEGCGEWMAVLDKCGVKTSASEHDALARGGQALSRYLKAAGARCLAAPARGRLNPI